MACTTFTMYRFPCVFGMQLFPCAVMRVIALVGFTKQPKGIRSGSFFMFELTSDTNRVHEESMSVVCKLDQNGLSSVLGPWRHRWQTKAFESGCLA